MAASPSVASAEPGSSAIARGRLLIVLAALLWSTSGAFTKILTVELPLGLHQPRLLQLMLQRFHFTISFNPL